MRRFVSALLILPLISGCGKRTITPYLGKWTGSFEVDRVAPGAAVIEPGRNDLKGFLQIYARNRRFELHLDGEQFGLIAGGSWSEKDGRLNLAPTEVKIDDGGGQEARNPNRAWVEPADLSKAYSRPLSFRISKDGQSLIGLMIEVGPLTGTHRFKRDGFGR